MDRIIDIVNLGPLVRQKWYWIVLCLLIGIGSAHIVTTYFIEAKYSAETKLLVSRASQSSQGIELGEIETNIQMIHTYRDIIQDPVVLDKVREELGSIFSEEDLRDKMEIVIQSDSQIFGIRVVDTNPKRAALIADTIAAVFKENVGSVINIDNVAILSLATIPTTPVSPNYLFNLVIGALTGLIFSTALIVLSFVFDKKVHDESFAVDHLGWIQLGSISTMSKRELLVSDKLHYSNMKEDKDTVEIKRATRKEPKHV
ncbi:capsular biosynthesis protein [Desemzia sp. RIT804]|uniref:YveK family protein n=1 Tax=Desemzia sp. RIT 804 TaxID=2810209 RepID=UPI00194E52D8|nr:Wzz/FepE/Etk N-terminal domain-containing protein [Desemzia sp. RIT 804]MBM6615848.1 capsular biosynthesis protein [Desemzia sp. RIT 804]